MADTNTPNETGPATLATSGAQGHQPEDTGMTNTDHSRCLLDWCDGPAHPNGAGLCGHHRRLELDGGRMANRWLYGQLADYWREDWWMTALPTPPKPERPAPTMPAMEHPDGSRYGLATLRGMVNDLAKHTQDGRSDALMRMAYRAARLVTEGHLSETVVRNTVSACLEALYPAGDRGDKRARARRRADDAVRDGLAA